MPGGLGAVAPGAESSQLSSRLNSSPRRLPARPLRPQRQHRRARSARAQAQNEDQSLSLVSFLGPAFRTLGGQPAAAHSCWLVNLAKLGYARPQAMHGSKCIFICLLLPLVSYAACGLMGHLLQRSHPVQASSIVFSCGVFSSLFVILLLCLL